MIIDLPAELVVMCCQYLNFDEVAQFAWTSKRIMRIVRRNLPIALVEKAEYSSYNVSIYPAASKKMNEFLLVIRWICPQDRDNYNSVQIRAIVRNSTERKRYETVDMKMHALFQKYLRYCHYQEKDTKIFENWSDYATKHMIDLASGSSESPFIDMRWLLAKTAFQSMYIHNLKREQFLLLVDALDSTRSSVGTVNLYCNQLMLNAEEIKRCDRSSFLQNGKEHLPEMYKSIAYDLPMRSRNY